MKDNEILNILTKLVSSESKLETKKILLENNNERIKRILYLSQHPKFKYFNVSRSSFGGVNPYTLTNYYSLDYALNILEDVLDITNVDIMISDRIHSIFMNSNGDIWEIICLILNGEIKKVPKEIINDIYPKLIPKTPYQGAISYNKKKLSNIINSKSKLIIQDKEDGCYCNIIVHSRGVYFESRQGEKFYLEESLLGKWFLSMPKGVYQGEITIPLCFDRQNSNGTLLRINKYKEQIHKRTLSANSKILKEFENEVGYHFTVIYNTISFTLWDYISLEEYCEGKSNVSYEERFDSLKNELNNNINKTKYPYNLVSIVEHKIINNEKEIKDYLINSLNEGKEGVVVKTLDGKWKEGKPSYCIKIKPEINLDLRIIGYKFGTGRNDKLYSSLILESEDGKLKTSASGLSDKDIIMFTNNSEAFLGKIVEIKCNGLTTNKSKSYSTLNAIYIEVRYDKTDANTLEECIEISNKFEI